MFQCVRTVVLLYYVNEPSLSLSLCVGAVYLLLSMVNRSPRNVCAVYKDNFDLSILVLKIAKTCCRVICC